MSATVNADIELIAALLMNAAVHTDSLRALVVVALPADPDAGVVVEVACPRGSEAALVGALHAAIGQVQSPKVERLSTMIPKDEDEGEEQGVAPCGECGGTGFDFAPGGPFKCMACDEGRG